MKITSQHRLAALGGVLALALTTAVAQVTPDRTYYGVGRAIPMTVSLPDGVEGDLSIGLLSSSSADVMEKADVLVGAVDLAGLFPSLWSQTEPVVQYAQLFAGDEKVGSAVVLQPMLMPVYAAQVGADGTPAFAFNTPKIYSGIRAYPEKHVVFETDKGTIEFRMRPDEAPNTAWNFMRLAEGGFYTDIVFHRIVPEVNTQTDGPQPFVIQAGDPIGAGSGGPGYFIDLEPSKLPHDFGVLSMARSGDPNSNGSQIFVCLSRLGTSFLDGRYTSFAEAVSGADVIVALSQVPLTGPGSQTPEEPPVIKRAYLIDAPPRGEGPGSVKDPSVDAPR
jgi:peptidyl-prolyl cis-trans isomerase B (cyclophilin B)